jgi:hypothetical protein
MQPMMGLQSSESQRAEKNGQARDKKGHAETDIAA